MAKKAKRVRKDITELTAGYEKFIEGKAVRDDGARAFRGAIAKILKPKDKGRK